jgi:hypothetical protein
MTGDRRRPPRRIVMVILGSSDIYRHPTRAENSSCRLDRLKTTVVVVASAAPRPVTGRTVTAAATPPDGRLDPPEFRLSTDRNPVALTNDVCGAHTSIAVLMHPYTMAVDWWVCVCLEAIEKLQPFEQTGRWYMWLRPIHFLLVAGAGLRCQRDWTREKSTNGRLPVCQPVDVARRLSN